MAENIEPKTGNEQKAPYPVARANQQAHPDTELGQESIKPIQAPAQVKPVTRPAAKAKTPVDERDEFIRNALPVAAALRKAGNPEEAKKLKLLTKLTTTPLRTVMLSMPSLSSLLPARRMSLASGMFFSAGFWSMVLYTLASRSFIDSSLAGL